MSLLNWSIARQRELSPRRRPRAFRPALRPDLEGLEQRTVLSGPGSSVVAAAAMQSPITIDHINVTNVAATGPNSLLATFNVTGTLNNPKLGTTTPFHLNNLQLPITLAPTTTAPDGCPILHLSLQIPDLNILGLHVRLDNCNGKPVTVDLTAIPGGGLLGNLLCGTLNNVPGGLTGLLNGAGGLLNLGSLTDPLTSQNALTELTGGLTTILNGILTDLTTGSNVGTGGTVGAVTGTTDTIPAGDCELVDLHLGPINANILGLHLTTSQICLNVFADPHGGLLGDLLCSLDNLLNNRGHNGHAINVLIGNVLRDLGQLGL